MQKVVLSFQQLANWEVETVPPAFQKFANNMVSVPPVSAS
jgi:hypothetical protein